jgi:hypothetical protein
LGLRESPGKTIQNKSSGAVGLLQPFTGQPDYDIIGHQLAAIKIPLGFPPERRLVGDSFS